MEELRSTEALDREILEDARKKAAKTLKTADANAESQKRQWEEKTQNAIAEIRKSYADNTEKARQEIIARFPLDKRRLRSEISETILKDAMNGFLQNMSRSNLLLILEREFEKRLAACSEADLKTDAAEDGKIMVTYQKMEEKEVHTLLGKIFDNPAIKGTCRLADFQIKPDANKGAAFPAIALNTNAIRITASVENAATEMLMDKRAELVVAMLGEGALND
jgi:vacuolar-type H+-ATPase subunit E/Vma4